jgi:hypothetical protein
MKMKLKLVKTMGFKWNGSKKVIKGELKNKKEGKVN